MKFSSKLIENAVEAFSSLPSIGKKTALRLVLHLMNEDPSFTENFTEKIKDLRTNIKKCSKCFNLTDADICEICSDSSRKQNFICVVESFRDVLAIEETDQFHGVYHIIGGVISPIEGISPSDLQIDELIQRVEDESIDEVVMAISPTIDGETTMYYISKKLEGKARISTLARGVSFGGELEYADGLTLGRSIISRIPYMVIQDQ
jgi:recombination protein RecR